MNSKYVDLEPDIAQSLTGQKLAFDASQAASLFTTTSFLYTTSIMLIVGVAAARYMLAGVWRIEASERGVRKSNEEIKRVTFGLLGVLSLFVILYTFNKDLLTGEVGLAGLKSTAGALPITGVPTNISITSGTPRACESVDTVKSKISSGNLCSGATCTILSGCNYQRYMNEISAASTKYGVDKKLIIATLCKENRSLNVSAQNTNSNGTYDCGLMQVNQSTRCDSASLDPAGNIDAGTRELSKIVRARVYGGIPQMASVAASYNAGPGYNSDSVDCTPSAGFPYILPKWACPINPGNSAGNMCSVKAYACDVSACVTQLSSAGL